MTEAGKEGELCVRGTSLAMGYYNNPEKTASAFCAESSEPCLSWKQSIARAMLWLSTSVVRSFSKAERIR